MSNRYGNGPTYGGSTMAPALALAVSIYDSIMAEQAEVKYPDLLWRSVIDPNQIIGGVNEGAQNVVKIIRDRRGMAAFQANVSGANIPRVGLSLGAMLIPLQASAVSASITNEDERQYRAGNLGNLQSDLSNAMDRGSENLIEVSTIFGDPSVGFQGFMSYTGIETTTPQEGASGETAWETKTAAEMVKDVNDAITYVWKKTKGIFCPSTVYLPMQQAAYLSNTPMVIGGAVLMQSALEYLLANNTANRYGKGKKLEVVPFRYLDGAGAQGSNRMILVDKSPENQGMPFPIPYRMTPPVPAPLGADLYAEQKHGSYTVFQPGSMLYVDGI